ncbi:outer membrane chaperone Skp [Rhodobacteraceae bacterium WD3A24]|nr:outer membrane chaperone Skp [Rhodobacteraceae bacterium WD3A24]
MTRAGAAIAIALTGLLALFGAPQIGHAQGFALGETAPVRTLDQERLFSESQFGQRVRRDVERASRELAAENERLQSELSAEEEELARRRAELAPDEFRALADEFNARVERIRREQEAKARAISQMRESERQQFFEAALPVLTALLRESGAVAILDSRAIFIAVDRIDITEQAIERLDDELGQGERATPEPVTEVPEDASDASGAQGDAGTQMLPNGSDLELPAPAD